MTLIEFLEARIAEDETAAANYARLVDVKVGNKPSKARPELRLPDPRNLAAECAAKRKIVQYGAGLELDQSRDAETNAQHRSVRWIMQQMARAYSSHPDYREESM